MAIFKVSKDKCEKDGICGLVCPARIIKAEVGALPSMREEDSKKCLECGQCVVFCPHNACHLEGLGEIEPFEPAELPDEESVATLLMVRRSIRDYKKKPVPKDELDYLLDVCRFAPTASNGRTVRWATVYEASTLKKLGDAMALAMRERANDDLSHPYASTFKALASNWDKGYDPFFRGAPHVILAIAPDQAISDWGQIDGVIALTYLEIMATAMNMGVCWGGYITSQSTHPAVREVLGLKDGELLAGAQMIGYPRLKPKAIPYRTRPDTEWL